MKPTGKQYEIDSFEQIINIVNRDNFESLSTDFIMWLGYQMQFFEEFRKFHPKECEGKTNCQLARCHFIWTDDGKNETNYVTIKNESTGEVSTFDLK